MVCKALGHANAHITPVTCHTEAAARAGDALARLLAQCGEKMETSAPETATVA
jgi:hypothetical protein